MHTRVQRPKLFALFIILCAGIGGILYGYDIGVISGAILFMQREIALSLSQISILTAAVLAGGALSTLFSGSLANIFGRRTMISIAAIIFIIGTIILIFAHDFMGALIGRLIGGIGVGIVTIVIPLYIAEAAPAVIRGSGVTVFQLFLTAGILLAYLISLFFVDSGNWRGMFWISIIPGVLLLFGSLFIVESPRWLFFKNKKEQTLKALQKTRYAEEIERDIYMMTKLESERQETKGKREKIWHKQYLIPFVIAFAIACLNQLTGINVLLQLSTFVLKNAGLQSSFVSMLGSSGIGLANFVVTIIALFLVDRVGRKPLLIIGTGGIVGALTLLGLISHFMSPGLLQGYLTIAGLILFIAFYAIGPGVVVWLAISELMPTPIRGVGMAVCLAANSLFSAALASVFLVLAEKISYAGVFLMCAGCTVLYLLTAIFLLPETKNKTLEEIEQYFRQKFGAKII